MWNRLLSVKQNPLPRKTTWILIEDLTYTIDISDLPFKHYQWLYDMDHDWTKMGMDVFEEDDSIAIRVNEPFTTDLTSTPRFVWWFLSPWDVARPAVIHDAMYRVLREQNINSDSIDFYRLRKQADLIFWYSMMETEPEVSWFKRIVAYGFVRVFGKVNI